MDLRGNLEVGGGGRVHLRVLCVCRHLQLLRVLLGDVLHKAVVLLVHLQQQ